MSCECKLSPNLVVYPCIKSWAQSLQMNFHDALQHRASIAFPGKVQEGIAAIVPVISCLFNDQKLNIENDPFPRNESVFSEFYTLICGSFPNVLEQLRPHNQIYAFLPPLILNLCIPLYDTFYSLINRQLLISFRRIALLPLGQLFPDTLLKIGFLFSFMFSLFDLLFPAIQKEMGLVRIRLINDTPNFMVCR